MDLVVPRLHGDLLLLIFDSDEEILVIWQIPYLSLTASLRDHFHQINWPLAIVVNHLQVVVDIVALRE
jgi:hypothetical protein